MTVVLGLGACPIDKAAQATETIGDSGNALGERKRDKTVGDIDSNVKGTSLRGVELGRELGCELQSDTLVEMELIESARSPGDD